MQRALSQHPAVADSRVVAQAGSSGSQLVAHVTLHPGSGVDAAELRRFLAQRIPQQAVPAVFDFTGQGWEIGDQRTDPGLPPAAGHAGPRDATEELLCEIWGELLGVERIGIHDDVFDLGAHSLTVMWAAARVLDRTGMDLPDRWFYEEPTVAGLARLIASLPPAGSAREAD